MTAPPGGPYGPGPYGTNPYGQDPSWGGQPQGGQPQGGAYPYAPGGQYPQQGGPYQYPQQGGPYQYPQGGPYANPQGGMDPSAAAAYPPQQFPQTGQQVPPGWPAGGYPPGPPPGGRSSKTPWLIAAAIALLGIIALVVILVVVLGKDNKSTTASSTTSAATSQPDTSQQTATDCTANVSGGDKPADNIISAGNLSFPASTAPGWAAFTDDQSPNLISAVGVGQEVPGANQWMMQAEVGITNFVTSMDVAAQASKLMQCVVAGPGYANSSPTLGPTKTSSIKVDGVNAARVDADVTIADTSRNVKGDSVTIIAVATKPVTIFLSATPIGDAASAGVINGVVAALKVAKS
jgi:hypothetical protein